MDKHTPGPWRVGTPGPNGCHTVGTERGLMVAMVAHSINLPDQMAEATENARLIAAAPDLLEALQRLWEASEGGSDEEIRARIHARAAIAKAQGEHQ
jgi:hypothetical protein